MTADPRRPSPEELRAQVRQAAGEVLDPGDPGAAVERLWRLGMGGSSASALGAAIWQIWERIHGEWARPAGDTDRGAQWARECAVDLLEALGDRELEREYCERWLNDERLGIIPPAGD